MNFISDQTWPRFFGAKLFQKLEFKIKLQGKNSVLES